MDELVDILDKEGNITGKTCMKSEAHLKGYWHPCIHVWLYTSSGDLLIQKRIASKDTFPNLWDVSVAGHVGAGENLKFAAQREVFEEVEFVLEINELEFIGNYATDVVHNNNLIDREYRHVYISELTKSIKDLSLQAEEVSEIRLISIPHLRKEFLYEKEAFVPYDDFYFSMVFEAIEKRLNKKE